MERSQLTSSIWGSLELTELYINGLELSLFVSSVQFVEESILPGQFKRNRLQSEQARHSKRQNKPEDKKEPED